MYPKKSFCSFMLAGGDKNRKRQKVLRNTQSKLMRFFYSRSFCSKKIIFSLETVLWQLHLLFILSLIQDTTTTSTTPTANKKAQKTILLHLSPSPPLYCFTKRKKFPRSHLHLTLLLRFLPACMCSHHPEVYLSSRSWLPLLRTASIQWHSEQKITKLSRCSTECAPFAPFAGGGRRNRNLRQQAMIIAMIILRTMMVIMTDMHRKIKAMTTMERHHS